MSLLFRSFTVPRVVADVATRLSPEITVYPVEAGETPASVAAWLCDGRGWRLGDTYLGRGAEDQRPMPCAKRLIFLRLLAAGAIPGRRVQR